MSIVIFILVLAVLVLSHEFGHFIVAKKSGIRVDEFGFGFPPRLFKKKIGDTVYTVNLLPLGGYVKIKGEDGSEKNANGQYDFDSFSAKSLKTKIAVIAAGVSFNFVLAWAVISLGFMFGLPSSTASVSDKAKIADRKIIVLEILDQSPAQKAGFEVGDLILNDSGYADAFRDAIKNSQGKEIAIKVQRDVETIELKAVPEFNQELNKYTLGFLLDEVGMVKLPIHIALWEGVKTTIESTIGMTIMIFDFLKDAFTGQASFDQVSGPVGIVKATGTAAQMGFSYILSLIAILSINLGIINLLPFPALDGGRILFLVIEKIKGSPISPKISGVVHGAGLILLLALMAVVTFNDILRLI